jgi:hypothetical protein
VAVKLALAAGLLLIGIAAAASLAHAPLVVAHENAPLTHATLVSTNTPTGACQAGEVLPRGTSAVRLGLTTVLGPRVAVQVLSHGRVIARGVHGPGWAGASVAVGLRPLARTFAPVTFCFRMDLLNGFVSMLGWHTHRALAATADGKPLPGRMHLEYLRRGSESWWSMVLPIARRLGLGRPASGTWNAVLAAALALGLIALSSWLVVRELG